MATKKSSGGAGTAGTASSAHSRGLVPVGTPGPEFTLHSTPDQTVSLSDFRGRSIILAFYPADWSPVCGDQLTLYNEILPEFHRYGAELMGMSVDGVWCHAAFARARHFQFPLLADFEPKGRVAQAYGAYNQHEGLDKRALFVLDGDGIVRWNYLSPVGVNPGADGILAALESMSEPGAGQFADRAVRAAAQEAPGSSRSESPPSGGRSEGRPATGGTRQEVR